MQIQLITAYYPPENGAAATLFSDLARELVRAGHSVQVITNLPSYLVNEVAPRYRGRKHLQEMLDGVSVHRLAFPGLDGGGQSYTGRGLWQLATATAALIEGLHIERSDVAIVYSPPLFLGLAAKLLQAARGTPFILNVQDLFPQSAIDLGAMGNTVLVALLRSIEKVVYRGAAHVVTHSEGNRQHVIRQGVESDRASVIPNWVDVGSLTPASQPVDDAFIVSFAGVMGVSQGLDVVLDCAGLLQTHSDIRFVLAGDGTQKDRLQTRAKSLQLSNVEFRPMLPKPEYLELLHESAVCLVTLDPRVKTPVVPSKIASIMAAGRPIVAAVDSASDPGALVLSAECGIATPRGDAQALADAILQLKADPASRELMAASGRRYAEQNLSVSIAARRFAELATRLLAESAVRK